MPSARRDGRVLFMNLYPTRMFVAAGALALAAAIPASAQAATITYEGDTLVYTAAAGETNATGPWGGVVDENRVTVSDGYGVTVTSQSDRCSPVADRFECEVPARMVFRLGDGDDAFNVSSLNWDIPVEVDAGPGNDTLSGYAVGSKSQTHVLDGGPGNDKMNGAHGNDVVRGGPGDDEVDGSAGNDTVEAGDGNDTIYGDHFFEAGTDTIDGGAGFDYMESDYVIPGNDFNPPVAVSFDGAANDGRPGENDNIVGVEKLDASVAGTFTGSAGADDFFVKADFNDAVSTINGLGGNDKLVGHDHTETIDGGPGDDVVEGGLNDDTLTGGPGKDKILGDSSANTCNFLACRISFGNDVINARDGEQDSIDCGVGDDRATVDAIDVVANCETVDKAGGGGGGGGQGATPGGKLNGPKRYTRKALRKGIAVGWDCTAACTVKLTLTADKKTAKRLGTKLLVSGKGSLAQAGKVSFRAKLMPKARKRIGRLRKGRGTIAVTVTEGGATQRHTQAVKLKR
jgi:Ca2+-binding RTX toxin-like protein